MHIKGKYNNDMSDFCFISQGHLSNFQALLWENISFSRQHEKLNTFRDSSQIQALFKVCANLV